MAEESRPPRFPNTYPLTEEQQQQVIAFIAEKWTNKNCPFHGPTRWQVNPNVGQLPGYRPQGGFAGYTFPAIVLTCATCGFMVSVNAIKAGVIAPDKPEMDAQDTEGQEPVAAVEGT